MSQINAIYNANVYLDGNNLLGKAGEFKLPEFAAMLYLMLILVPIPNN
jgi:phage tail tube protein FII